jgi:hypothetical protein
MIMLEIGSIVLSVELLGDFKSYQDDFLIPGILPSLASSRKQMRQRSKSRMYPRFLPHLKQRLVALVLNLGAFLDLAMTDVFAIEIK